MRILLTADWHLSELHQDWLIEAIQRSVQDVLNVYREQNCSYLVVCGDVTHDKNYVYNSSMNYLRSIIEQNQDISFCFLVGNHDYAGSTKNHGLKVLEYAYQNVDVVDEIVSKEIDKNTYVFVPHSKTVAEDVLTLKGDVLISHFGLNEAELYSGLSINSKISLNQLLDFKRIFLGHYHYAQKIEKKRTKLYYTGSIAPLTWNEKNQGKKSVLVVDTKTLNVEQHILPNSIELIEYVIENEQDAESVLQQRAEQREKGNFVRVKSLVSLKHDVDDVIYESTEIENDALSTIDDQNILNDYLTKINVPKNLSIDKLVEYGTAVLEKAKLQLEEQTTE